MQALDTAPEPTRADPPRLPSRTVRYYGIGQAAEGITNHTLTTLLLFFYTSVLGLSGTLAGAALMIGLVVDALSDPLLAVISDRTRSRLGRRHPFMYASAVPLGLFLFLAFLPPPNLAALLGSDEQWALFLWLTVFAVLTRSALTLYHVPHLALGAELTPDFDERTRVVVARSLSAVLGTALAVVAYFTLVGAMQSPEYPDGRLNPAPYSIYAALAAILIVASILVSSWGTRDRIPLLVAPEEDLSRRSFASVLLEQLVESVRIPSFRALFLGFTLCFLAWGFTNALGTHSALYLWHISIEVQAIYGLAVLGGYLIGMGFWKRYADAHDKKPAFILGLVCFTVPAAAPPILKVLGIFPAESSALYVPTLLAVGFAWSFGIASALVVVGSMMADITDEDELLNHQRREGMFFGAVSFSSKAASGLGVVIAGLVYDAAGLHQGLAPAEAPAHSAATLGFSTGLIIFCLISTALVIFNRYDITRERHAEIRAALDGRAAHPRTSRPAEIP